MKRSGQSDQLREIAIESRPFFDLFWPGSWSAVSFIYPDLCSNFHSTSCSFCLSFLKSALIDNVLAINFMFVSYRLAVCVCVCGFRSLFLLFDRIFPSYWESHPFHHNYTCSRLLPDTHLTVAFILSCTLLLLALCICLSFSFVCVCVYISSIFARLARFSTNFICCGYKHKLSPCTTAGATFS